MSVTGPDPTDEYRSIWTHLAELEFRQGFVTADGVRTRYIEAGDPRAPTVLMLHGTGGHWETFAPNLPDFARHFHCLALDMVGNGFSSKPDHPYEIAVYVRHLRAVLEQFGLTRVHVVGMSLGAWVAAALVVAHPETVERMVLMSPAGLVATASNMARIRAERTRAVENPDWDSIHAIFEHLIAEERHRIPDVVALRQAIYRRPDTRATIDHLLVLQDPEARDRNLIPEQDWRAIAAPTLVVASGQDFGEYQETARTVAGLIPQAEILEMPHVKHWPHFEDPAVFDEAAVAFLTRDR